VITAVVRRWSAWSPGREDAAAWHAWARTPGPLEREGCPDVGFLPAMLRRRCSPLARIMLATAYASCPPERRAQVRTVFASRHGNINESIPMLDRLAERQPISPTKFSHTVHNAQAGLFSIAADNRQASSSVAAQQDTFACGYLEALTHLQRDPRSEVLLVMADIPLAPTFAKLVEEPVAAYGLAVLLAAGGAGQTLAFGTATSGAVASKRAWPDAMEFLRWFLTDDPSLSLGSGACRWIWERGDPPRGADR
jgi:hypothetical protein